MFNIKRNKEENNKTLKEKVAEYVKATNETGRTLDERTKKFLESIKK